MNNKSKLILYSVLTILFYFLVFIPYLHNRDATRVVASVLKAWTENDFINAFEGWETQQLSPPIYGVLSSKILKKVFNRKEGIRHAEFYVLIQFSPEAGLPSDKIWEFDLKKTRLGWKITNFHLSEEQSLK